MRYFVDIICIKLSCEGGIKGRRMQWQLAIGRIIEAVTGESLQYNPLGSLSCKLIVNYTAVQSTQSERIEVQSAGITEL